MYVHYSVFLVIWQSLGTRNFAVQLLGILKKRHDMTLTSAPTPSDSADGNNHRGHYSEPPKQSCVIRWTEKIAWLYFGPHTFWSGGRGKVGVGGGGCLTSSRAAGSPLHVPGRRLTRDGLVLDPSATVRLVGQLWDGGVRVVGRPRLQAFQRHLGKPCSHLHQNNIQQVGSA
jgi:hypothetical protein